MKNVSAWLVQKLLSKEDQHQSAICQYEAGQCVFRVGDPGDYLAVVLAGSVDILKNGTVISVIEHGGMFGEMALIDAKPRSADAVARSHCRIAQVREGQFLSLIEATPYFSIAVMRILTERLRHNIES